MHNDSEEDLKKMYPFDKKEIRKLETPANIISEVRSILISIFPWSNYLQDYFSFSNHPELFQTAPLPFRLHDIDS
jgi:hypothetical protein